MVSRASESPSLPSGWYASQALSGVDLRLQARGRKGLAVGVAVFALVAGWRTFVNWQVAAGGSVAPWVVITSALALFAIWCAFADELWHIERNHLVHRVGIGLWTYSHNYRDAELQIIVRFARRGSLPYYRLYAIENGKSRFLLERGEQELGQLATFISFHTGWPVRPMESGTFTVSPF
jgi:hypothetical protein